MIELAKPAELAKRGGCGAMFMIRLGTVWS